MRSPAAMVFAIGSSLLNRVMDCGQWLHEHGNPNAKSYPFGYRRVGGVGVAESRISWQCVQV
jgi:hypothetical protein